MNSKNNGQILHSIFKSDITRSVLIWLPIFIYFLLAIIVVISLLKYEAKIPNNGNNEQDGNNTENILNEKSLKPSAIHQSNDIRSGVIICENMEYDFELYSLSNEEDLKKLLPELKKKITHQSSHKYNSVVIINNALPLNTYDVIKEYNNYQLAKRK